MDDESGEFQDWELLHNSDDSAIVNSLDSVHNIIRSDYFSLQNHPNNYPSVDFKFSGKNKLSIVENDETQLVHSGIGELGCIENDETQLVHDGIGEIEANNQNSGEFQSNCSGPESISSKIGDFDPSGDCKYNGFGVENKLDIVENDETLLGQSGIKEIVAESENLGEFWSEPSGIEPISSEIRNFDPFGDCKFSGFGGKNELGIVENDETQLVHDGIGEILDESENPGEFWSDCSGIKLILSKIGDFDPSGDYKFTGFGGKNELGTVENDKTQLGKSGIGEIVAENVNSGEFWFDSSGIKPISSKIRDFGERNEMAKPENEMEISVEENIQQSNENESIVIEAIKQRCEDEKRRMVWWKLPLELLRYCAISVSPVWIISVAAAVLGFVILGRILHKMTRKSRSLQLKVIVDDKVSQFMSKAACLNEAFSIVKRVPVKRTYMPVSGVTPWPVMNLR